MQPEPTSSFEARHGVCIRFANGQEIPFNRHELRQALRHFPMLATLYGLILLAVIILSSLNGHPKVFANKSVFWALAVSGIAMAVFLFVYLTTLVTAVVFAHAHGRPRVYEPLTAAISSLGLYLISLTLVQEVPKTAQDLVVELILGVLKLFGVTELLTLAYLNGFRQNILNRMNNVEPATPAQPEKVVTLADVRVTVTELLQIEVSGHYLSVATKTQTHRCRATMKEALSQLDPADGVLVHRSNWVAAQEILEVSRLRGDLILRLRRGSSVKVARPRRANVEAWLREQGHVF